MMAASRQKRDCNVKQKRRNIYKMGKRRGKKSRKVFDIFQCYAIEAVVDPLGRLLIMLARKKAIFSLSLFTIFLSLYRTLLCLSSSSHEGLTQNWLYTKKKIIIYFYWAVKINENWFTSNEYGYIVGIENALE